MSISIKKDSWHVKDGNGQYRGTAIFSSTLPSEAQQIVTESIAEINAVKATIPADYTELSNKVDGLDDDLTDLSADVTDLSNAIGQKAPLIINTASGDVASFADGADGGQIRKIVGTIVTPEGGSGSTEANIYCYGVNLFNKLDLESDDNHYLSDNGNFRTPGSGEFRVSDYIPVKAGFTYTLSNMQSSSTTAVSMCWYTADKTYIRSEKYLSAITSKTVTAPNNAYYARLSIEYSLLNVCQFELGSAATSYKGFTGNSLLINWQSEAGTILNGTVTLNEDGSADVVNSDTQDTYHLTDVGSLPTYYGVNNVWIDTGSITECDYPADTKLYVDGLTAPDEDMIANANIASGKYFVVNNQLYLSTAAIAAGASIVPGTNCTATNLAEALNALNT